MAYCSLNIVHECFQLMLKNKDKDSLHTGMTVNSLINCIQSRTNCFLKIHPLHDIFDVMIMS